MVVENTAATTAPQTALDQFVSLAKAVEEGDACLEIVRQALEASGVYVFGELMDLPNISKLADTHGNSWNTLNLFAYGTYKDYAADKSKFIELSVPQQKKLQHLTIVTLATKNKCIPYGQLLTELNIKNVRDLEDVIIEAIYAEVIQGKLDQKNSQLEIDFAIGRDIRPDDVKTIVTCLESWCTACENVLSCVETQIKRANTEKNAAVQRQLDVDNEISNIKKTLKTQLQERADGSDEVMATDSREAASSASDKGKKSQKTKGLKLLR